MTATTFETVARDSLFKRLDFRAKLLVMAVLTGVAFLWESPLLGGLLALSVTGLCLVAGVRVSYLRMVFVLMLPFYALLVLTQGFFAGPLVLSRTGQAALTPLLTLPASWWLVGGASMSLEGVLYALNIAFKTLTMTLVIPLGVFTTDVNTMLVGLVKLYIPYKLAFVFSSTLRFFPLLVDEIQSITEAQRLRGLAWEQLGPVKRVQIYSRMAVPLILGALAKSQMLELSLQAKAFSGSPQRTYLHDVRFGVADYGVSLACGVFLLAALVGYFVYAVGRF